MTEAIMVALITGGLTLAGTVFSIVSVNSRTLYRIEQLEKKQDKHNHLIERMYAVEKDVAVLNERLNELEDEAS